MLLFPMQADSQMSKDRQVFYDASLQYVFKIQEVQERKKFEFVEPVSSQLNIMIRLKLKIQLQCNSAVYFNAGLHKVFPHGLWPVWW